MKKSIVLLISLLFISAISLLILDNLKDSEKYISISQNNSNLTQTNISILNLNAELKKLLNKINKNDLDEVFEKLQFIPPFGNVVISNIKFSKYTLEEKYDIQKNYNATSDTDIIDNINYRYDLYELAKNKVILNNRQVDNIIDEYINLTSDNKILNIKDKFTFKLKDYNSTKTYISYNYNLQVNNINSHIDVIFEHKTKQNLYFDFYFIGNNNE